MKIALVEAKKAFAENEVPVGALLVKNDVIIEQAHNITQQKANALMHAESIVINRAIESLKSKHLDDCYLFVTLEPCPMCAGAIVLAKIPNVIFGAYDSKAGAGGTLFNLLDSRVLNHRCNVTGGIMQEECSSLLTIFFENKR